MKMCLSDEDPIFCFPLKARMEKQFNFRLEELQPLSLLSVSLGPSHHLG